MGGIGALIVIGIYIAFAVAVVRHFKTRRARYAAIAFVLLLPTADAIVGRIYVKYLCATEGGLKVFRTVDNVEGLQVTTATGDWVTHFGFQFEEGPIEHNGTVIRHSRRDGEVVREINVQPKSLYRSRFRHSADEGMIAKSEAIVEVISTGEVLASYTGFYFRGGWAERVLGGFSDAGPGTIWTCDEWRPEVFRKQTVINALRPAK